MLSVAVGSKLKIAKNKLENIMDRELRLEMPMYK